jgi:SSS family solute:Na+ symporter
MKPDATMKEMLAINRISVLIIVASATIASFYINSIMDAIHIATFIASASYFFPLMGGLYWKRATKEGALAGLVVGGLAQIGLIIVDLAKTAPMAPSYLETVHPILVNHGIIVGMLLSAVAFFGVSLITKPSDTVNLAPFFESEAEKLALHDAQTVDESNPEYIQFLGRLKEKTIGERAHLQLNLESSATVNWNNFIDKLKSMYPAWVTPSGNDSVYRLIQADMLACVSITRGHDEKEVWFASEPRTEFIDRQRKELFIAFEEVEDVLKSFVCNPRED